MGTVRYTCNGVVNTNNDLDITLSNLFTGGSAHLSYTLGQFGVIIDRPTTSVFTFTTDNIYGDVNIRNTGFQDILNKVTLRFDAATASFQEEQVILESPSTVRNDNEPLLERTLTLPFTDNNIEAERLGSILLNNSRQTQLIDFRTDLAAIQLQAGDVVSFSFAPYGIANKLYRITSIQEEMINQSDANGSYELPGLRITCLLYTSPSPRD